MPPKEHVAVMLDRETLDAVDRERGSIPRSTWLREEIRRRLEDRIDRPILRLVRQEAAP